MRLEKAGLNFGNKISAWARTSSESALATRPVNVNTSELRLAPNLEKDFVEFSNQANRWTKNPKEYIPDCSIPNSQVPSHHVIDGKNSSLRDIEFLKKGVVDDCEMASGHTAIRVDKEFANLAPLEKDCIGYRIVGRSNTHYRNRPFQIIENAKIGDKVVLDEGCAYAFQQESLISQNNYNLKNPMIEVIRIPKGARVSRNMEHGGEILMPRGAQYKLISKEFNSSGQVNKVILEYILPKSKYPEDIEQIKQIAQIHVNSTDDFNRKYAQKILDEIQGL